MRTPDRNPYESYSPRGFAASNPPGSPIGGIIRQGDARLRLREMEQAEATITRAEALIDAVADRADRMRQLHALSMKYLVEFGCRLEERHVFREVLTAVSAHGGSSLREAADLAHTIHRQRASTSDLLSQRKYESSEGPVSSGGGGGFSGGDS